MALIKMSSVGITAISGKAGGSVYSRNRGGEYVKNFVMPTNTFSEARQAVRALFGSIASGWRSLTQNQRNSWIEAVPYYLRTNAFGDQKQLTPNALYVGQNQNLANAGFPLINTIGAPQGVNSIISPDQVPVFDIGTGDAFSFGYDLEADPGDWQAVHGFILEATPAHNASKKNVQNQFRKLATSETDGSNPQIPSIDETAFATDASALLAVYEAKFGTPNVGDIVSFRIKAVNPRTGEASVYWQDSVQVTETS